MSSVCRGLNMERAEKLATKILESVDDPIAKEMLEAKESIVDVLCQKLEEVIDDYNLDPFRADGIIDAFREKVHYWLLDI